MPNTTDGSSDALLSSATDEATNIVCNKNLHQCLWLSQTDAHERLRVTFSTTNNFSNNDLPTMLFSGPMFGSRWTALDMNRLAVENEVRIICVDRPGMGGSTRVPLKLRIPVWLETVPVLLEKLNVKHVGLLCHSTGIIYVLNTLYYLRDILDPQMPYVACMAPWVNNEHPHTALMKVASKVPNSLFDYWHDVAKFAMSSILPVTMWSGAVISSMGKPKNPDDSSIADRLGTTDKIAKEIERLRWTYAFTEDTSGMDGDARLCLRKEGPGNWGVCEDYAKYVRDLIELERERSVSRPEDARLTIHAYFASSDIMIGKSGQGYFERCWRQDGVEGVVEFESFGVDDADHDGVLFDTRKGGLARVLGHYARSRGGEVDATPL